MFKKIKTCKLHISERWGDSFLVTYPVSYRYNGGTIIEDEYYEGFEVVKPSTPKGYELVGIGCGLQLNAHPPYATSYLRPLDCKKKSKKEVQAAIENA
jgi:hypothetical protein